LNLSFLTHTEQGFGNIGSLGIQIGVLSQISPKRSGDVVKVSVSAFLCGVLSTLTSASIAGMLFMDGML
jgi:CNT family concentrative nucleoside transporter